MVAMTGNDAYLIDVLVSHLDTDREHRGLNEAMLQALFAESLDGVDEDVAPLGLVLVLGQLWASCKLRRVFREGFARLEERDPVFVEEQEDVVTDRGWERAGRLGGLDAFVHLVVVEVLPLVDKGLPDD